MGPWRLVSRRASENPEKWGSIPSGPTNGLSMEASMSGMRRGWTVADWRHFVFTKNLSKSMQVRDTLDFKLRPELLLLPQIPKPLHGLAPRVIMGSKWWNETRQAAYASTKDHCLACGVHKLRAKGPKWVEGHETYRTDYVIGRMYYIEAVPLCHFCHNYIHQGRLQALLEKHQITQHKFTAIMLHGERILSEAGLVKPPPYDGPFAEWSVWRLVLNGKMYKPLHKSLADWEKHFS